MIVLDATTNSVQVVLGGAITTSQLNCFASWRDITTTAYTPGKSVTNTNSTTDVDLVSAPGASTQRVVDYLSVYNADTVAATVTLKFGVSGTEYVLWKGQLSAAEKLEYVEGTGFRVFSTAGVPKTVTVPSGASYVANQLNVVSLASDVTNSTTAIADVTGLSFAVVAGQVCWFRFVIWYTSAATTTGSRWAVNGPGSPTAFAMKGNTPLIVTANSTDATSENYVTAYDTPTTANTGSPNNSTNGQVATMEGYITPSSDGTLIARFASEVAASAIVAKAGSHCQWMRTL